MVFDCLMEFIVGGNWGVRVKGRPKNKDSMTNIFFYAGLEGFGDLHLTTEFDKDVHRPGNIFDKRGLKISRWKEQQIISVSFRLRSRMDLKQINIQSSNILPSHASIRQFIS
jgi:hypothetical protein